MIGIVKKKDAPVKRENPTVDENVLFERISAIIGERKYRVAAYADQEIAMIFRRLDSTSIRPFSTISVQNMGKRF